jgi:hypothetical protein
MLRKLSAMREGSRQFEDQEIRIINLKTKGVISLGKRRGKGRWEEQDS